MTKPKFFAPHVLRRTLSDEDLLTHRRRWLERAHTVTDACAESAYAELTVSDEPVAHGWEDELVDDWDELTVVDVPVCFSPLAWAHTILAAPASP